VTLALRPELAELRALGKRDSLSDELWKWMTSLDGKQKASVHGRVRPGLLRHDATRRPTPS